MRDIAKACTLAFAVGCLAAAAQASTDFPGDIRPGHFPVGPNYAGWITDSGDVLTTTGLAYCFKDIDLVGVESLVLHLGYDDGCHAFWNGFEILDARFEAHGVGHWNHSLDLNALGVLQSGRNRLTLVVYNNCNGGSGEGGLNLQLDVDGSPAWPDAAANPMNDANEMWYTGGGCDFEPPLDGLDRAWSDADYGWLRDTAGASERPSAFALEAVYPNPFNPSATVAYRLAETGVVRLSVLDALGRQVALLQDGLVAAGRHELVFDASGLASGLYFARLESEDGVAVGKMLLIR